MKTETFMRGTYVSERNQIAGIRAEEEDEAEDGLVFDEFGFRIDVEDGPEQNSSKLLSTPFEDNPHQRLKWLAHLEFAQSSTTTRGSPTRRPQKKGSSKDDSASTQKNLEDAKNGRKGPLAWDTMVEGITRTNKLR